MESSPRRNASAVASASSDRIEGGIQCLRCGVENRPDRKFCGDCGAPIWFDCEKCAKPHPAHEKFCGSCGADIAGRVASRLDALRAQFETARQALDVYRFRDADVALSSIARYQDLRFASVVSRAKELLVELPDRRRDAEEIARKRFATGLELATAGRLADARRTLEFIPEPMRSPEMQALLDNVASQNLEIDELKNEVKRLYADKNYEELLPKLERLSQLRPEEKKYRSTLEKACEKILERGVSRFSSHQYAKARGYFRILPPSFAEGNEELARRMKQADEMLFLERRLTRTPWTTPSVEAMTSAFVERAGDYEKAMEFAQRLTERKRARPADARRSYVDWRKVADSEAFLPTVEHAFSRRLTLAENLPEEARRLWKSEPGRFFCAIGVALQALGKSILDVSLDPEERKSLLASFSLFRGKPRGAWGLDCSPASMKGAHLSIREDGEVLLHDLHLTEAPPRTGDDEDFAGVAWARRALRDFKEERFAEKRSQEGFRFGICVPSDSLIGRWFRMPLTDEKTLDKMLAFEAKTQIPFPLDELRWDWQRLDVDPTVDPKKKKGTDAGGDTPAEQADELLDGMSQTARMMILAVRRSWLDSWHAVFKEVELKPTVVQADALALASYAHYEWNLTPLPATAFVKKGVVPAAPDETLSLDLKRDEAIGLIDFGAHHTNVVVVGRGLAWFRSFVPGSHRVTQKIAGSYQLTTAQAEAFKRDPFIAKRFAHLYELVQPLVEDFHGELERSLRLFRNAHPDATIQRFFVTGGGARFDEFPISVLLGPDRFFDRQAFE